MKLWEYIKLQFNCMRLGLCPKHGDRKVTHLTKYSTGAECPTCVREEFEASQPHEAELNRQRAVVRARIRENHGN